jgi:hypothetical protein
VKFFSGAGIMKRKHGIAVFCTLFGAFVAIKSGASLTEWTVFAAAMVGTFGAADVADKKLNGGTYDEQSSDGRSPPSN